jgi:hypothetical protein
MNNTNTLPIGTPRNDNPDILEWVSAGGGYMLQHVGGIGWDEYRFCRACSNGNWIVEKVRYSGKKNSLTTMLNILNRINEA